jgi:hypothetical protein
MKLPANYGELAATGEKREANSRYCLKKSVDLQRLWPEVKIGDAVKALGSLHVHEVRATKQITKGDEIVVHYGTSFVKKIGHFVRKVDDMDAQLLAQCSTGKGIFLCKYPGCKYSTQTLRTKKFTKHILRFDDHLQACIKTSN